MWIAEVSVASATGILNTSKPASENKLFPNPAIDFFYLQFGSEKDQAIKIDVVDLQGKQVKELYNSTVTHGINTLSFNKGALPKGIYVVRILSSSNQTILQEKLVVGE